MSLGKLIFESSTPRVSLVGWLCCCDTGTGTGTGKKAGKFNQDFGRRKSRIGKEWISYGFGLLRMSDRDRLGFN